jgi:hypothetical protein
MNKTRLQNGLRSLGLLLQPARDILAQVLPDHAEKNVRNAKYRKRTLVPQLDAVLVAQVPEAALVPVETRRSCLERIVAILVEDLVPVDSDQVPLSHHRGGIARSSDSSPAFRPERDLGLGVRGITVESTSDDREGLQRKLLEQVGQNWTFSDIQGLAGFYRLVPPSSRRPTVAEAWELSRKVGGIPGIRYAEPSIYQLHGAVDLAGDPDAPNALALFAASGWGSQDHEVAEAKADPEWSLEKTFAKKLWVNPKDGSLHQGSGILVGHIDTGYTHHPEVNPNVDAARGYDTWDKDSNAEDDLDPSFWDRLRTNLIVPSQPGHGTGTGSVIASPVDSQVAGLPGVTGTAPRCTLIPIRATPTVVILPTGSQDEVAAGIVAAVARGAHVISMSLGSPWYAHPLEAAVQLALREGVIVCAAAGNVVLKEDWFTGVTYPAAFPGVVAVAACDYHRRPWRDGCRGPCVAVTAPGTDVWRASAEKTGSWYTGHKTVYSVGQGSGTSFAVATLAGIAACWLRYWQIHFGGRDAFIQHLGGQVSAVPEAFRECLRSHQATPLDFPQSTPADLPGFDPSAYPRSHYGVGVVNAAELLKIVPRKPTMQPMTNALACDEGTSGRILAELARVSGHSIHDIRGALAADLGFDSSALDARLKVHGRELIHHFATNGAMRRRLDVLVSPESLAIKSAVLAAAPHSPKSLAHQLRGLASPGLKSDLAP